MSAMLPQKPAKKRPSAPLRLSSLLSLGSSHSHPHEDRDARSVSSDSSSRISRVGHRLVSATHLSPGYAPPSPPGPSAAHKPAALDIPHPSAPLEPPPVLLAFSSGSASPGSRPGTPAGSGPGSRPSSPRDGLAVGSARSLPHDHKSAMTKLKRRSGLFGSSDARARSDSAGDAALPAGAPNNNPLAWVVGHRGKVSYNLDMLLNGEKVPELWDDEGDTLVYLFPRTAGKGASFRIHSSVYAASQYMTRLVYGGLYSEPAPAPRPLLHADRSRASVIVAESVSSRTGSPDPSFLESGSSDGSKGSRTLSDAVEDDDSEKHLYLPIQLSTDTSPVAFSAQEPILSANDIDTLVTYRNFIAFLLGQSLVATDRHPDIFIIFLRIADVLQHYQFSNLDGSTFGEIAAASFDSYVDELNLADVRVSREKTIEAIVLGERMRSVNLYTEGFVHAAGKWDTLKQIQYPKFELISHKTLTRVARAAMDLDIRVKTVNLKLTDFDFPAIFSGVMDSDNSIEQKLIRFKYWRSNFMSCRSFIMDYYKSKYGSWLPRAKSRKNSLTTSGLNRLVLLGLYNDLTSLYDLLVDRKRLTTRTADGFISEEEGIDFESIVYRALRQVLSEYDRSTPPVQPPIPFDLPLYPTLMGIKGDYPSGDPKSDIKARSKKLKGDDLALMLRQSHNADSELKTPFLEAWRHFEFKQAHGSNMEELYEMRTGHWMFLYAVIQSLPMLVADVPGVRFTEGVEYFLCEPPRSGVPWGREDTSRARTWFGVAGGAHVVSLPTDIVEHGVEGVFRRTHCWRMAVKWSEHDTMLSAAVQESIDPAPLPPPPGMLDPGSGGSVYERSQSPGPDWRRQSVMNLGLEALPLPSGVNPPNMLVNARPSTSHDPNKTFDDILSSSDFNKPGKDKDKKKK